MVSLEITYTVVKTWTVTDEQFAEMTDNATHAEIMEDPCMMDLMEEFEAVGQKEVNEEMEGEWALVADGQTVLAGGSN